MITVRFDSKYGFDVTAKGFVLGQGYIDGVNIYIHDDEHNRPTREQWNLIKEEAAEELLENYGTPQCY